MANLRQLTPALAKKAESELNEYPERIAEDLNKLKDWLRKQPHLKTPTDDQFLIAFLRATKYSLERTKEKLDLFFTVRSLWPEITKNRDPSMGKMAEVIKLGLVLPLPVTNGEAGPRFVIMRFGKYDPTKYTVTDFVKLYFMIQDIMMMEDDNFVIGGLLGIVDVIGLSTAHVLQYELSFMKKMVVLTQEASPFRQKGYHYINTTTPFQAIFNLFKSFLGEKMRNRLYVHGNSDTDSLYKFVPKKFLPTEYGGEAGSIQDIIDVWEKKLLSHKNNLFMEWENYDTNEKLRPGKQKNAETLFGMDGTFRKLNVD